MSSRRMAFYISLAVLAVALCVCSIARAAGALPLPNSSGVDGGKQFRNAVNDALDGHTPIRPATQLQNVGILTTTPFVPDLKNGSDFLITPRVAGFTIKGPTGLPLGTNKHVSFYLNQTGTGLGGPFTVAWQPTGMGITSFYQAYNSTIPSMSVVAGMTTVYHYDCVNLTGTTACIFEGSSIGNLGVTDLGAVTGTVTPNLFNGSIFKMTLGATINLLSPSNIPTDGQIVEFVIAQASAGSGPYGINYDLNYSYNGDTTSVPQPSTVPDTITSIKFTCNNAWVPKCVRNGGSFNNETILLDAKLPAAEFAVNAKFGVSSFKGMINPLKLTVLTTGTESCATPPTVQALNCNSGSVGTCSSPNVIASVQASGTTDTSVSTTTITSASVIGGYELRFKISAGTCATPPNIYATLTGFAY